MFRAPFTAPPIGGCRTPRVTPGPGQRLDNTQLTIIIACLGLSEHLPEEGEAEAEGEGEGEGEESRP